MPIEVCQLMIGGLSLLLDVHSRKKLSCLAVEATGTGNALLPSFVFAASLPSFSLRTIGAIILAIDADETFDVADGFLEIGFIGCFHTSSYLGE